MIKETVSSPLVLKPNIVSSGVPLDPNLNDDDALVKAIQDARDQGIARVKIRKILNLLRPPPSLYRIHLEGDDSMTSILLKRYSGGLPLINFSGPAGYSGGGLHNLSMGDMLGGGCLIYHQGDGTYEPDLLQLEYLYLGSAGERPFRNIHLVAQRRSPLGIRQAFLSHITCFGTTNIGNIYLSGIQACSLFDISVFPGANDIADLYIAGSDQIPNMNDLFADQLRVQGTLYCGGLRNSRLRGNWLKLVAWSNTNTTFN